MTNFIQFTISNLDLRIEKAGQQLKANETGLGFAVKDKNADKVADYKARIGRLQDNIAGYKVAQHKLNHNLTVTPKDAEYIIKGLNIRKKRLNENLEACTNAIKTHEKALKTKENQVVNVGGGFSATIQHYDDVSVSIIEKNKERVAKITNSLGYCETALKFFEGYLA